ncbi:MAG TPA: hypothetical protein VFV72_17380 [Candidatus Limnocylindrales bacterium]|nr:hypothetical protein [Candidatus Limnocylindrales bacterium]
MTVRLAFIAAAVVVTALALGGILDGATARLIVAVHAVVALTALFVNIWSRGRLRRAVEQIRTAETRRVEDALLTPPGNVADLIARFRPSGYQLVGAIDTSMGGGKPIRTWILAGAEGDVWVEAGLAVTPMAVLLSQTPSGRFVETAYPRGEEIDEPELLAGAVKSSVEDALAQQHERLTSHGGPGRRVVTMDDYLEAERVQRVSNGGLRIKTHLAKVVGPSIRDFAIAVLVDAVAMAVLLATAARASSGG